MKLPDILSALPKLNPQELEEVDAHVRFLRQTKGGVSGSEADVDLVLQSICECLMGMGVEFCTIPQLRKSQQFKAFAAKVPSVMKYVREAVETRNEQRVILELGARLLYQNLTETGLPAGARTVMSHLHRLPSVINREFPGYAASGLLGLIVSARKSGNR